MPCILKVRVIEAADVLLSEKIPSVFVEIKFSSSFPTDLSESTLRTSTIGKGDSLIWNEDFRFEVIDEVDLQTHPLTLRLGDGTTFLGALSLDLNPLVCDPEAIISGFFPISDTEDGIQGRINIQAKILYFGEANSPVIKFFVSPFEPQSFKIVEMIGLVDVLLTESDPEYHWTDSFRATRTSNAARHSTLSKLTGELKKLIGEKVSEMGGNAVVGFSYSFDFEPFSTSIIARGLGTAVKLISVLDEEPDSADSKAIHSSSIILPATMELFTLKSIPEGSFSALRGIGGLVTSKSVKLLTRGEKKQEREQWLFEIREEIKSHAKMLKCTHVLGYSESISVSNDLLVISAVGTAVLLNVSLVKGSMFTEEELPSQEAIPSTPVFRWKKCFPFHSTLHKRAVSPFEMDFTKCNDCKKRNVPEILLCTIASPFFYPNALLYPPSLIDAYTCRAKRTKEGETNATAVSNAIPFIEYDIHRQLLYKMRLKGFNVVFDISYKLEIGEDFIVAVALGTGYFIHALPRPTPLKITRSLKVVDDEDRQLIQMQEKLMRISTVNREKIDLLVEQMHSCSTTSCSSAMNAVSAGEEAYSSDSSTESEDDSEVIEIDDDTDEDLMCVLMETELNEGSRICTFSMEKELTNRTGKFFSLHSRQTISKVDGKTNKHFADLFKELYSKAALPKDSLIGNICYSITFKKGSQIAVDLWGIVYHLQSENIIPMQEWTQKNIPTFSFSPFSSLQTNMGLFSGFNIRENGEISLDTQASDALFEGHLPFNKNVLQESLQFVQFACEGYSANSISYLQVQYVKHEEEPNYLLVSLFCDLVK